MRHEKKVKFLKGLLNVIGFFVLMILIIAIVFPIMKLDEKGVTDTILSVIFGTLFFSSYLIIIFNLKRVLSSVHGENPFIQDNVTRFRRIGYCIFFIGIIDAIIHYQNRTVSGFMLIGTKASDIILMGTSKGSLKPIFFLYLVLGILAFILADVFKMAIDIKDENDLTI